MSTSTLLCKHGWCENLLKMYLNCPIVPHTLGGAHWDYMLVKENKCKLGGMYIFVEKVQRKNMRQPACRMNFKQYCQKNIQVKFSLIWMRCPRTLSISSSSSGAHWDNVNLGKCMLVPRRHCPNVPHLLLKK